jgi:hypothetical protein
VARHYFGRSLRIADKVFYNNKLLHFKRRATLTTNSYQNGGNCPPGVVLERSLPPDGKPVTVDERVWTE